MYSLLFVLAVIAFLTGWHLIATMLVIAGAFLTVYEKSEERKQLAREAEQERWQEKAEAQEEHRLEKAEAQEEQSRFDEFYREKGFPHIYDKVRVAEFARNTGRALDEAETVLCAADALGSLDKGENIAAFERYAKQRSQRDNT
jgi:Sec-independent protein translocase protein TatA